MSWAEHVHPHGELTELAPGFWQVTGSMARSGLSRNMSIWRVPDGIAIHSGVCLSEGHMAQVEALGKPRVLIVPNRFHRHDASRFKERYPEIRVLAPKPAREQVEKVIDVWADCEEVLPTMGTECLVPTGLKSGELVYRVPCDDGRHGLVFCDALFNHADLPGLSGWFFKRITRSTGHFGITGLGRMLMLEDGPAFAGFLRALADERSLAAISVAHGEAITDDPARHLREAADRI